MNIIKSIYRFYADGFKNMTTGKVLWKIVIIKIIAFLTAIYFVSYFLYDIPKETKTKKANSVYHNLVKE